MYLNICAAYLSKHVQIRIPSCNQNRHNRFQSSFLKGAATLHISLRTEQKMGKRKKDRQKDKDEDTSAQRQRQNTGQIMFEENLWCLTQTPQILVKFHIFWIEDLGGEWC